MTALVVVALLILGFAMSRVRRTRWWACVKSRHEWEARWEWYPPDPSQPHFGHTRLVAWCASCGTRTCMVYLGSDLPLPHPGKLLTDPQDPSKVKDMGRPWSQTDADTLHWGAREKGSW